MLLLRSQPLFSFVDASIIPGQHFARPHPDSDTMPRLTPDYPGYRKPPRFAYLRSFLPCLAFILLFSFLLASYSLLSHFHSPAGKQQIGWQSWDVVEMQSVMGTTGEDIIAGGNGTDPQDADFVPSIPLDNWVSTLRSYFPHELPKD